jgi:hypothetical protein
VGFCRDLEETNGVILENWGSTPEEIQLALPGDNLVAQPAFSATRSISIAAPTSDVFPWITQLGLGRAGWYSYDIIDNFGRKSATQLHPEWAVSSVGDSIPGGPIDFVVTHLEAPHHLVMSLRSRRETTRFTFTLAYVLRETPEGTRLISRVRSALQVPFGAPLLKSTLGPGDGVMLRRQLLGLKERAESHRR